MSRAESRLWQSVAAASREVEGLRLTRFENALETGVADVEYVSSRASGWIELKTSLAERNLRLNHPLSVRQLQWLLAHDYDDRPLRSYVLVGLFGPRAWRGVVLLRPSAAVMVLTGRRSRPLADVLKHPGATYYDSILRVLTTL